MLVAELDLLDGGQVLDVDSGREFRLVPFDLGQHRFAAELDQIGHPASSKGCVASELAGALEKLLAIADRVSDLDWLRSFCPFCHDTSHCLCRVGVAQPAAIVKPDDNVQGMPWFLATLASRGLGHLAYVGFTWRLQGS